MKKDASVLDGEEDVVLTVQNLIRLVTHIDYMEMLQFDTQSAFPTLEIRENPRRISAMVRRFCSLKRSMRFSCTYLKTQTKY